MKKRKKNKSIPMRKDILTGKLYPKAKLLRIVKDKNGKIELDITGKKAGHGAYLSPLPDNAKKVRKLHLLNKVFHQPIESEFYMKIIEYCEKRTKKI